MSYTIFVLTLPAAAKTENARREGDSRETAGTRRRLRAATLTTGGGRMKTSWMMAEESNRLTWLLMGAVLALAALLTALEFTSSYNGDDIDDSLLEDMFAETEPYPIVETSAPVARQEEKKEVVSADLLKVAEADTEDDSAADDPSRDTDGDADDAGTDIMEDIKNEAESRAESAEQSREPLDFRVVQQIPEFPGGMKAFVKWLTANLRYPASAQKSKQEGKVVVTFIVNEDGSTADIKVAKPSAPALNTEALRVMNAMPKWKPGLDNGKPCRTIMAVPIIFKQ